jgi:hypothetical protein
MIYTALLKLKSLNPHLWGIWGNGDFEEINFGNFGNNPEKLRK